MTEPETTCKGFEVNHLVKQYANADKPVLDDISFKVEHGSVLVVLGPSGSGKSTLLRTIAGLEPIQGGTISINDQVIDAGKPGTERAGRSDRSSELRTRIGMVFQSYDLFPNKTVLGNITMAPVLVQKRDKSEVEAEAIRLLGRVGLADRKDSWPHELSGGQRQRVAICRALILHPEVLLLDEITAALDPEMVREVLDVVLELAKSGQTMLIVTHEMQFARAIADTCALSSTNSAFFWVMRLSSSTARVRLESPSACSSVEWLIWAINWVTFFTCATISSIVRPAACTCCEPDCTLSALASISLRISLAALALRLAK